MTGKYADIINLARPLSTRDRMPVSDRAAQFSPFAALTGHEDAVRETARRTEERLILTQDKKEIIDRKLQVLRQEVEDYKQDREEDKKTPQASITYFLEDEHKAGGSYECVTGQVKKIDEYLRLIILAGDKEISLDDIIEIDLDSPHLDSLDPCW